MATFGSKEESGQDQVPLHCSQQRICSLRAMIHMIANSMGSELWALEKFQASMCKLVSLFSVLAFNLRLILRTIRRRRSTKSCQIYIATRMMMITGWRGTKREPKLSSPLPTAFRETCLLLSAWLNDRWRFSRICAEYFQQATQQRLKIVRKNTNSGRIPSLGILPWRLSFQNILSECGRISWHHWRGSSREEIVH